MLNPSTCWCTHGVFAGEAAAILARAEASAEGLRLLAEAITAQGGSEAVSLRVAEQYLSRWAVVGCYVCATRLISYSALLMQVF